MSVEIPIAGIGDFLESEVDKLLRVVVFEVDAAVKENTPVDTGRMAASWMIGENEANGEPKGPGKYTSAGDATGSNYKPGQEKVGNVYSIHNNLPYAEVICYTDHSKKVDPGWFELIAKNTSKRIEDIWNNDIKGKT
jgi:hypothetical protein